MWYWLYLTDYVNFISIFTEIHAKMDFQKNAYIFGEFFSQKYIAEVQV